MEPWWLALSPPSSARLSWSLCCSFEEPGSFAWSIRVVYSLGGGGGLK
jgi:hypothetical protein